MGDDDLFGALPEQTQRSDDPIAPGAPRMREPRRDQIELRAVDLESLIGEDHPIRVIWSYVAGLDLSVLEDRIKARGERPGRASISPRLLLSLWLYATSEGVGSARALERLCESHDAYRWLCGGVSVNHHTLGDFRVNCADLLDRLLVDHLAALAEAGLINLDRLAQDGVRIRAHAGASSFRRGQTLDRHLAVAEAVVDELKRELDAHPDGSNQRLRSAKERAARKRVEQTKAAQRALEEIKQRRKERQEKRPNGKTPKEPRVSTTDPQARVMKMADGGFRPAYNVQVASVAGEQIIAAVEVSNNGSDRGLMRPMIERVRARLGRVGKAHLADGGFCSSDDIEWAHGQGIDVYCPPVQSKHGTDPYLPRRDDGPGVLAWRARMGSQAGQAQYKQRSICECIHARWRNWSLRQLTVNGIEKVSNVMLWYALANNVLQGHRLTRA